MSPEPLPAVVIGAGSGGSLSIRALAESPRYTLRGVVDLSPAVRQRVAAAHPEVTVLADYREALQRLQPEVVCVATWPPSHLSVVLDAIAGVPPPRGLLVEKPLAHTWRDGRRLVNALRRRAIPCVVPHGLVVSGHGRAVLDQVHSGAVGAVQLVWIECRGWDILNAGIHWLHFALQVIGGPFVEVQCACDRSTRTYRDGMQVETVAALVATAASGARIALHTGDELALSAPAAGALIRIVGSEGLIELWGWEPRYRIVSSRCAAGAATTVEVAPGPQGHALYLHRLADQIAAGAPEWGQVERSLAALELCDAAYTSAREQRAVSLRGGNRLGAPGGGEASPQDWDPGSPYTGIGGGRDGRR